MSYDGFTNRIRELWWLYQLGRAAPPTLVLASIGFARQLRSHEEWADKLWSKAIMGSPIGVDDIPAKFIGVPPETDLPEELKGEQTFREMHEFGQEMNRGKLPELIFVNSVFAFECEIGHLKGCRSPALSECFQRRHKYAHSGGVADQNYLDLLEKSPLKAQIGSLTLGEVIPANDEILLESVKVLIHEARQSKNR